MIWFILGLNIILFSYLGDKRHVSNGYHILFRILLIMSLSYLPSFGALVAQDHYNYAVMYHDTYMMSFYDILDLLGNFGLDKESTEIGYLSLNVLGKYLNLGIPGFFFLICCIINTFIVLVAYRFPNPALSLLFFAFLGLFNEANLVRQSLAIAIFYYSLRFIEEKSSIKYIVFILFAMAFHTSAVLLIPLIFVMYLDLDTLDQKIKNVLLLLWIFSLFAQFGLFSVDFLLTPFIYLGLFSDTYSSYIDNDIDVGFQASFGTLYITYVLLFLLAYLHKSKEHYIYTYIVMIACIFINLAYKMPVLFRFGLYFTAFIPISIPFIFNVRNRYRFLNTRYIKIMYTIFILYYLVSYFMKNVFGYPLLGSKTYSIRDFFM